MTCKEARNKLANIYINLVQKDGEAAKPFRIAVEAIEKQIPEKPVHVLYEFVCPRCRTIVRSRPYCGCCGQALDWNDEE